MKQHHRPTTGRSAPGQRQLRVGERIRHVLSEILRREHLNDPVLEKSSLITVTSVDVGPDLKHAIAYIMPLGGKNADAIIVALNKAAGYFRSEVAPEMDLRYTPKITFRLDTSFEQAEHLERLLRQDKVQKDLRKTDHPDDNDSTKESSS